MKDLHCIKGHVRIAFFFFEEEEEFLCNTKMIFMSVCVCVRVVAQAFQAFNLLPDISHPGASA